MKKIILCFSAVSLLLVTPAFAIFSVGSTENFNTGLSGWKHSGDVSWVPQSGTGLVPLGSGAAYANLGKFGGNGNSKMKAHFVAPTSGEYTMSFDYRFSGKDSSALVNDSASAGIYTGSRRHPTLVSDALSINSATGLTGNSWKTVTTEPMNLEGGKKYWVGVDLNESRLGGKKVVTKLDIDNVSLSRVHAVPAPGAILLASVGAGLVGWLRHRKAL